MNNEIEEKKYNIYNIKFVSKEVYDLLCKFKNEMNKMESLQDSLIAENNSMKNSWQGEASEKDLSEIDKFRGIFENIKAKNQKYVNALNTTINSYSCEEEANKNTVDENINSFDFTRQKGV